jgi:membrane-anchored protein YejM (alkaline phosphatase superfamily)
MLSPWLHVSKNLKIVLNILYSSPYLYLIEISDKILYHKIYKLISSVWSIAATYIAKNK